MFLAILSHDLRNPLNCIRTAAHLVSGTTDPGTAEALSEIESQTEVMARLISDLIDFASAGVGSAMPLTRGPVDLEKLCREVLDGFRSANPKRTLRFHANGDLTGQWDAARLRQVVSNLLGNALQHGSKDGAIELSAHSDGSTVVFSVHNEGAPIPSEMLATIFDPLVRHATQESAADRVPGSIGLGLYIVREIVLAHGGTIDVVSTRQEGTRFTVRLPRAEP
jgi:signal transduction histidine kinase